MRRFLVALLIGLLIGGGVVAYLYINRGGFSEGSVAQKLSAPMEENEEPLPARPPGSYHILEDQGGIPAAEAERGGLVASSYAYLYALEPLQQAGAIEQAQGVTVAGKRYDFCFRINSEPGEKQLLEFNPGGEYSELHFGFGFEDTHPSSQARTGLLKLPCSPMARKYSARTRLPR